MEVVKTSKLKAPVSNTNLLVLRQLPGSCPPATMPPAQGPQGLQPSPSYKAPNLQFWEPSFFKASPRQTLLLAHSCYHPSRVWILNPGLGGCWKPSAGTRAAKGQDRFSQMLFAPALNWTLETKIGQKRSGEVGKCAQQRPWFDAGNYSAFLG